MIAVISLSIFAAFNFAADLTLQNKAQEIALNTAQEKIEFIKGMTYNDIGTLSGNPTGTLPDSEIIIDNNINFTVYYKINYIDDGYDNPGDPDPNDYKRIQVTVEAQTPKAIEPVKLVTDISP